MTLYSDLAAVADELLAEFGQRGTLRLVTRSAGDYDPTTGTAAQTVGDYPANCALFDCEFVGSGAMHGGAGMWEQGDKQCFLSAVDLPDEPNPACMLHASGVWWRVMNVKSVSPAGTPVIYELKLRR